VEVHKRLEKQPISKAINTDRDEQRFIADLFLSPNCLLLRVKNI